METRGRKKKITVEDVIDTVKFNQPITMNTIALKLGVSTPTARNRVREARKDGITLLFDRDGLRLCESVTDENKNLVINNAYWAVSLINSMAVIGKTLKRPLIEVIKNMNLPITTRKKLKKTALLLERAIDETLLDEELD